MRFSEKWLREWVNPAISTDELAAQLTMAGLEVDAVEPVAAVFSGVVIAEVKSVAKHPDADKLRVCQVDGGSGETLQIVCGAANVREGLKVPLATIGAVLPGDFKIKKSKLRGVESFGMLCSEKELGMAEISDGLMELPGDAPVGMNIRDYLEVDDQCIEIDLTPNRSDCLSVAGVARELAALNQCDLNEVEVTSVTAHVKDSFPVQLQAPEACPRYLGRVLRGVNTRATTPLWMVERLRRSGIRSLGAAVDVTNFVMLELGQPMHAFDLDTLQGSIQVRMARPGEKITLLDGKEIEATADTLLIADEAKPLALAGIMGGEGSGVSDSTHNLFLECAYFSPLAIAGKAREFGLHTDSSHRFERGVDPELCFRAMERATHLLLDICGGEAGPVQEQSSIGYVPQPSPILLRASRIQRLLGFQFEAQQVEDLLVRLGMKVETQADASWLVTPPSFRFDITIEADLIEELVRVYGYNNIPRSMPRYQPQMRLESESQLDLAILRRILVTRGYLEAISYSFVDPAWQAAINPDVQPVALANPISAELSVMRTSIWAGLLRAVQYNLNRQQSRIRLFETGLTYIQGGTELEQRPKIAGVICGEVNAEQWAEKGRKVDFFDLKGDVEAMLAAAGQKVEFIRAEHPALHPGQTAQIVKNGLTVGWLGLLHPQVQKQLDISQPVYLFELDQTLVLQAEVPVFTPLSKFPEVRRDIAVLVREEIPVNDLIRAISKVSSDELQEILVFDVYTGTGIENGLKSVALGLILQG
ncbi:MAG: phenylalanine--tRNA ligase subunit beta, partial [Gammaproteobacteria bacterium]